MLADRAVLEPFFTPFPFGRTTLPNRFVMAPMTRQQSPGGVPTGTVAAYYRRRAEGGVGLIVTEGTYIDHPAANGEPRIPAFHGPALEGWQRVVDEVHAAGAKIVPQIWHYGNARRPGVEPDPAVPGYGPMEIRVDGALVVRAMTRRDIRDVVESFARAAADAERLGFDGVELHGAHEYLIDSFLWGGTNRRDDEYGGSLANRGRFAVEIVRAVRGAVGPGFPLIFRYSQWKQRDYAARLARSPAELAAVLTPLAEAGVDLFDVSTRRFWEPAFEGGGDTLAAWTRRLTGRPVITVGSIGLEKAFTIEDEGATAQASYARLATLAEAFARGDFDLAALGRVLLAEPEWPARMRAGRIAEIRGYDRSAHTRLVL